MISFFQNSWVKESPHLIFFGLPTFTEIIDAIQSLSVNKALGHDHITAYFLRIVADVIVPYLQYFFEF